MVEYKHGLSKGLCRALAIVVKAFSDCEPHDIKDMGLDYTHRCNFQKLRYWGLVEKVGDAESKGGKWRVTEEGMMFVRGNRTFQKFVFTYRGEVVRREGERISIMDVADGWKYRPEYAAEAVPRGAA